MQVQNPENYSFFTVHEFVEDEFFRKWVLHPDESSEVFWTNWLQAYPNKSIEVAEAKLIVKNLSYQKFSLSESEVKELWNGIQHFEARNHNSESKSNPSLGILYKVAASIVLCVSVGIAFWKMTSSQHLQYHTAYGETKTIMLPDSSTVILNSNSSLQFNNEWNSQDARELWLDGEAYFSVVHKINNQPFKVHTEEGMSVEVLGTTFNVYHRTDETKVVLNTGKIKLHLPSESAAENIVMKPGEFVEYKRKSFSKRVVNPAIYTAWTENKLILDHTSLRDMVEMLKNNYGVEVTVSDKNLLNQTVSGSMPIADVESLVVQIAQTFQLKVDKQNNKFLMH